MKKYNVKLYYITFITKEVEAEDEGQAVLKASKKEPVFNKKNWNLIAEFINNREAWTYADTAEEI